MVRPREADLTITCFVCGHVLAPYLRICDKCGSIQRAVAGDGMPIPPDRLGPCEICAKPILKEEKYCIECLRIWLGAEAEFRREESRPVRRAKIAAASVSSASAAAAAFSIWALAALSSAAVFVPVLVISGMTLIFSTVSLIVLIRRSGIRPSEVEIQVLHGIVPPDHL